VLPGGANFCSDPTRSGLSYAKASGFLDLTPARPRPGKFIAADRLLGPIVDPKEDPAADLRAPGALCAAGAEVQQLYCAGCHQLDDRGIPGEAAHFVEDQSRLAKPDRKLLAIIEQGNEARAMPAFGAILSPLQQQAVLAYLRSAFGAPAR